MIMEEYGNTVSWIYVIEDLNGERIVETFYEKTAKDKLKGSFSQK